MFKTLFIALVIYWILHFTKSGMTDQVDELKAKYKEYREASKSYIKPAAIAIRLFWLIVFAPFFALVALFEIATALSDAWKQTVAETKAAANAEPEPATVGASNAEATEPETVCASNDEEDEMPSSVQDDEPEMEEKPVQKIYRHYGSDSFSPELLRSSQSERKDGRSRVWLSPFGYDVKPYNCFWASPVEVSDDGTTSTAWHDWCSREMFRCETLEKHFDFHLSDDAKILEIHNIDQWNALVRAFSHQREPVPSCFEGPDWGAVFQHYDGVEMFFWEYCLTSDTRAPVGSWDVDSIAIWNPDVIVAD